MTEYVELPDLSGKHNWVPDSKGSIVGVGSVTVAMRRLLVCADPDRKEPVPAVIVYTMLPGFRANALACAKYLCACRVPKGSMLDSVLGVTVGVPRMKPLQATASKSGVHSLVRALASMAEANMHTRVRPIHLVMKGHSSSDDTNSIPFHEHLQNAMRAVKVCAKIQVFFKKISLSFSFVSVFLENVRGRKCGIFDSCTEISSLQPSCVIMS